MFALRGCKIVQFGKEAVSPVGILLALAHTSDVVDGFVVVTAARQHAAIVTSDGDDIGHLLDAVGVRLPVLTP